MFLHHRCSLAPRIIDAAFTPAPSSFLRMACCVETGKIVTDIQLDYHHPEEWFAISFAVTTVDKVEGQDEDYDQQVLVVRRCRGCAGCSLGMKPKQGKCERKKLRRAAGAV